VALVRVRTTHTHFSLSGVWSRAAAVGRWWRPCRGGRPGRAVARGMRQPLGLAEEKKRLGSDTMLAEMDCLRIG
jgi:hypothetical protein